MDATTLTIGQLANQAEVTVETIRYYERRGLIPEPARRASGYRIYFSDSVARLRFIKNAQELGFSLAEIDKLLSLRMDAETSCAAVRKQAEEKLDAINEKIQNLRQLRQALTNLVAACEQGSPQGECPILESLELETQA